MTKKQKKTRLLSSRVLKFERKENKKTSKVQRNTKIIQKQIGKSYICCMIFVFFVFLEVFIVFFIVFLCRGRPDLILECFLLFSYLFKYLFVIVFNDIRMWSDTQRLRSQRV